MTNQPTMEQRQLAKAIMANLRRAPGHRGQLHTELEKMTVPALQALQKATQYLDAEIAQLEQRLTR